MRILLAIALVVLFGAVAVAASSGQPRLVSTASPTLAPRYTAIPAQGSPLPPLFGQRGAHREARLYGRFIVPIDDIAIPDDPDLLPGAARDYRAGYHEGVDFPAPAGTPVHAAADGRIVRIDLSFLDWDREQQEIALSEALELGYTPAATLDRVRGRQVWVDHGGGVITRYAHLVAVEPLAIGQLVEAGAVIGEVGSTGYPQGGPHLHFEVRDGDDYYGDGLAGDALVRAVSRLFR